MWHQVRTSSSAVSTPRLIALFRLLTDMFHDVTGPLRDLDRNPDPNALSSPARASFDIDLVTYADLVTGVWNDLKNLPDAQRMELSALWPLSTMIKLDVDAWQRWFATTAARPQSTWMCDHVFTWMSHFLTKTHPITRWFRRPRLDVDSISATHRDPVQHWLLQRVLQASPAVTVDGLQAHIDYLLSISFPTSRDCEWLRACLRAVVRQCKVGRRDSTGVCL